MIDGLEAQHDGRIISTDDVERIKDFMKHLVAGIDNDGTTEKTGSFVIDKANESQTNPLA